ncbi:hypothetical protein HDR66_00775 [bacterium]|nr:hypothetical protein [bacterium]
MSKENFNKYAVTEEYLVPGKTILIIGAAGNWGSHFAAGMALAAHADLVLVDIEEREADVKKLEEDILGYGLPIKINTYLSNTHELAERNIFYKKMEELFGEFAAIMDVEKINTDK